MVFGYISPACALVYCLDVGVWWWSSRVVCDYLDYDGRCNHRGREVCYSPNLDMSFIDANRVAQSGNLLSICYRLDGRRFRFERS